MRSASRSIVVPILFIGGLSASALLPCALHARNLSEAVTLAKQYLQTTDCIVVLDK